MDMGMIFTEEQRDKIFAELSKKLTKQRANLCFTIVEKGTWKVVGEKSGLKEKTIKWHWSIIAEDLGLNSRVELLEMMIKIAGLTKIDHPNALVIEKLDKCLESLNRIEKSLRNADPILPKGQFN